MTALTLIRHGETDWNRDRRIQGSTDIPLNDTGREQAREAGRLLRERLDAATPVTVAASDLSRARETAEIIAAALGADAPRLYPGLRERAYGEAEGVEADEFFRRWGDWHSADVPGAEPRPVLRERALGALRQAVRDHRRATGPGEATLIVVAHGALIRELIGHASGGELPGVGVRLVNGSAHDLLFERDRIRLVSSAVSVA
ncbi:histidine phosphatase family protein [Microbacterium sp. CFBP9034]|uniref:histidine phosphatase family protein n=1 Tax=Microbacterium sp. CFBP9034 TaxID=3096540 RepID=UPI002A6AFF60|nr:histidine phosphatase family protein [Microbacterium sp. CFBP9034]MDY0909858.1 histidine phosphatase family protein [Microbacterium sp. CFBP9034]